MAYLGEEIKKLGFGLMRLPRLADETTIDLEQVKQMVDLFLSKGFTYFDTAWAYPGSEDAIRQALVERYPREKFQLATKNAAWINCKTREDAIAQFETSLRQTGAGYFDFYLLHNLGETRTEFFERFNMWDFVFEKKREGKIKHVGFSFHSTPEELDEILTKHPEVANQLRGLGKSRNSIARLLRNRPQARQADCHNGANKGRFVGKSAGRSRRCFQESKSRCVACVVGNSFRGKS